MSESIHSYLDIVEQCLVEALAQVRVSLVNIGHRSEVDNIQEYIYHSEYGLALEDICAVLENTRLPISNVVYALLEQSGKIMNAKGAEYPTEFWQMLKPQIKL